MPLKSSPTASAVRTRRAFTLAEMLFVVAIIAIVSGVLTTSLVRASPSRERQAALGHLVTYLSLARLESMQTSKPRQIEVGIEDHHLHAHIAGGSSRSWRVPPTTLSNGRPTIAESLRASFDAFGRTSQRTWNFIPEHDNEPIWTIAFDPLSGSPHLMRTYKDHQP